MKKKISIAIAVLTALFCALACAGCNINLKNGAYRYDNANAYSVGNASVSAESVSRVLIDWVGGAVTVVAGDREEISFEETTGETDDKYRLHYAVIRGELKIRYQASGVSTKENFVKPLIVTLPREKLFTSLKIDSVNGNVSVSGCKTEELEIDSVNAGVTVGAGVSRRIEIDTVNGNVSLTFADGEGFRVKFDAVNGSVSDSFGAMREGDEYGYGSREIYAEVDTVNGNLSLNRA